MTPTDRDRERGEEIRRHAVTLRHYEGPLEMHSPWQEATTDGDSMFPWATYVALPRAYFDALRAEVARARKVVDAARGLGFKPGTTGDNSHGFWIGSLFVREDMVPELCALRDAVSALSSAPPSDEPKGGGHA